MLRQRILFSGMASLLLWSVLPVCAGAPGSFGAKHGIYVGESTILDVDVTRQLTLREDVRGYQFSPSGEKIAYVTYVEDHGDKYFALKVVNTWQRDPEVKTLTKQPMPKFIANPPEPTLIEIVGWAGDDRYLLFRRESSAMGEDDTAAPPQIEVMDLSASTPTASAIPIEMKHEDGSVVWLDFAWSPAHDRLLIGKRVLHTNEKPPRSEQSYFVYDPFAAKLSSVGINPVDSVMGWLDGERLLTFRRVKGAKTTLWEFDLASGAETVSTCPSGWGKFPDQIMDEQHGASNADDPKDPSLRLDTVTHILPASRKDDEAPASTVWIQRSPAPKKLSALPVAVTPGSDPPQARWSPTGKAVAFVSHGDLFLTSLIKRPASSREQIAAGETLPCSEVDQIAASNLKQIGLGLIQYAQDYDENYPPASGVEGRLQPYLQNDSLYSLGDSKFVYHAPPNLSMASIASPSDYILGEMTTPCARIVLYADGSVKTIDQ